MSSGRSSLKRAYVAGLILVALLHIVLYPALYAESYSVPAILLYGLPASFAIAAVAVRWRQASGTDRMAWLILLLALGLTLTLDTALSISVRNAGDKPYPNLRFDVLYLGSYVVYVAAVGLLTSGSWWRGNRTWAFDTLALLVMTAGLVWHFVVPQAEGAGTLTEKLLANAYLTLDLLFVAVVLVAWRQHRLSLPRLGITAAALLLAVGDAAFYFVRLAFDSSWTVGLWLIALSATLPETRIVTLRLPRFVLPAVVPYALVGCVAIVTVIEMPGGGASDLLASGAIALALVVLRQVVSLKDALREQQEAAAFREALLGAQSELGLGLVILHHGRVTYANPALEKITGRSLDEIRALSSFDSVAFFDDIAEWPTWHRDAGTVAEMRIIRGDGVVAEIEVAGRQLPGTQEGILLVVRDITERKYAAQAIANAHRLEGLGALAGGVAHDFNNLLSTIFGHVGLLRMGELDDEARDSVQSIQTAARRGAELTRRLLDFARPDDVTFAVEDLVECVEETLALARPGVPVNVQLRFEGTGIQAPVRANRSQLVQAFLNLVLNARDAVGDHGRIDVRIHRSEREARLEVTDNGPGIDEATRARIFEPFYSTKRTGAGTGLGLVISQRTIRDHRGSLDVQSEPGSTTFVVTLPLAVVALAG